MRKHTQRWRCSAKSHGTRWFDSRNAFDEHFHKDHDKQYSDAQLDLLAERALQSLGNIFEDCPLCGGTDDPDASGSLMDHIVGHLRSLALKSLPPHYEDGDDLSSESDAEQLYGSRSTLRDLLNDQKGSLIFSTSSDQMTRRQDVLNQAAWTGNNPSSDDWLESATRLVSSSEGIGELPIGDGFEQPSALPLLLEHAVTPSVEFPTIFDEVVHEENPRSPWTPDLDASDTEEGYDHSRSHVSEYHITATFEGFRQHILHLNPRLAEENEYLLDRMAHQQVYIYANLLNNKAKHQKRAVAGECPSQSMCQSMDGLIISTSKTEIRYISPKAFPSGVPMPPSSSLPAKFECTFCFQVRDFSRPSDWTEHILEDLQCLSCTWHECCSDRLFKRRIDWFDHEIDHQYIRWWTCNVGDCYHTCHRKADFLQHLAREHSFPEPQVKSNIMTELIHDSTLQKKAEECYHMKMARPHNEPCRFCGRTMSTWTQLSTHLARHMEKINLPILRLVAAHDLEAHPILDPQLILPQGETLESPRTMTGSTTNGVFVWSPPDANSQGMTDTITKLPFYPAVSALPPVAPSSPNFSAERSSTTQFRMLHAIGEGKKQEEPSQVLEQSVQITKSTSDDGRVGSTQAHPGDLYDNQQLKKLDQRRPSLLANKSPPQAFTSSSSSMSRWELDTDQDKVRENGATVRCVCGFEQEPETPRINHATRNTTDGPVEKLSNAPLIYAQTPSGPLVQCVTCKAWQHGRCVGITTGHVPFDEYFCEACRIDLHTIRVAKLNG